MQFFKDVYPSVQKMVLVARALRKGEAEVDEDLAIAMEDTMLKIDNGMRERLFICTVAAEKGWSTAAKVAFRKKGQSANDLLVKRKSFKTNVGFFRKYGRQRFSQSPHSRGERKGQEVQ